MKASHFQCGRHRFHLWLGEFHVLKGATKINHNNSWPLSTKCSKPRVRHLTWIFIFKPHHNNGHPRDRYYDHFNFINGDVPAERKYLPTVTWSVSVSVSSRDVWAIFASSVADQSRLLSRNPVKVSALTQVWPSLSIYWAHWGVDEPAWSSKECKVSVSFAFCVSYWQSPWNQSVPNSLRVPLLQALSFCSKNCGRKFPSCWYAGVEFVITSRSDVGIKLTQLFRLQWNNETWCFKGSHSWAYIWRKP